MNKPEDINPEDFDPVDLTNCDREPIHLLGAIQSIGFLLQLSQDWQVMRYSANIGEFLDVPEDLAGARAQEFFSGDAIHSLRNRLALLRGENALERLFGCTLQEGSETKFDVALHMSEGSIILEAEPSSKRDEGDSTGTVRSMVGRLEAARDMNAFFREGARQVRALTGYDRVMVYRFDRDGSGEVVAEAAKSGIGTFEGLNYPATDIPKQARILYKRSLMRVIVDVNATPVAVLPEKDVNGDYIDLSLSVLRSVSPIHIEYLKNMGVSGSMSISLIVEGELWGLIACHHYSPRCPSFERRSVCELFGQLFSMHIEARERSQLIELERRSRQISDQLMGAFANDASLLSDPSWLSDIITGIVPADGLGVWLNGNYAFTGQVPDTADFARIVRSLNATHAGRVWATDHIGDLIEGADKFANRAAGMLAIPISRTPRDYVILFREERVRSVRWAGNPQKPASYGPNGKRLHPRQSFEEWKQLVEGKSKPFTQVELRIAEALRSTLIEVVLRLADEANIEKQAASERQELLIAELNHRVRNILSLIRGLIRQSKPSLQGADADIDDFVKMLDGRIHALARAHNQITEDHWGPASFRRLIEAEVSAFLVKQRDRVEIEGPSVLLNPQAFSTMALVIHELVTNSTKYGSLSTDGNVHIEWELDGDQDLYIKWRESGGPEVTPPTRQGFGTTIIERSVPYDLGGEADVEYAKDGVKATFCIPSRHLTLRSGDEGKESVYDYHEEKKRPVPTHMDASPQERDSKLDTELLKGKHVLLVEDSLIIALDAEDILNRLGATSVSTEATPANAIALIESDPPDIAMLDINLGNTTSFKIANALEKAGIPFVFATGYGEAAAIPEEHRARPVLQKPYTLHTVNRRLAEYMESLGI